MGGLHTILACQPGDLLGGELLRRGHHIVLCFRERWSSVNVIWRDAMTWAVCALLWHVKMLGRSNPRSSSTLRKLMFFFSNRLSEARLVSSI